MKFRVRVTDSALQNAIEIVEWIRLQGAPLNAEAWFWELSDAMDSLSEFPERCPLAIENGQVADVEVRQRIVGEYRVLFTIRGTIVYVLHVRNAKMKPASPDDLRRGLVGSGD